MICALRRRWLPKRSRRCRGHLTDPGVRVGERGVAVDVLERDRLPRENRDAPAEARRERHLGVGALEQRVEDQLVERAVEVAAAVEQRIRDGQALAEPGL